MDKVGTPEKDFTKDGKVKAYRCSHSGMYLPSDYTKEWGRKYGIGHGDRPVSECLNTEYLFPVCVPGEGSGIPDYDRAMHPVGVTHAEIHYAEVDEAEYDANRLILIKDDPTMAKRVAAMMPKQLAHPKSKIRGLRALKEGN
jgi:hypothetical protein